MSLKKIPDKDQNLLCATLYLNSFRRAIEELVYNSLDAESTSIAIRVCIETKYIQVLDNGIGIAKDNFRLLGDKYATSKFKDFASLKSRPSKYGYKGISLASIIEISENVKISSKFQNSQETWIKTFHKNHFEEFCLTTLRPSKGTTVEVSGFLYNLNIQQKAIDVINEINNIKVALEQLSLVNCKISFSLRDDSKNEIIFKIHKNRNIYQTLWSLFQISKSEIQELQVEKNEYKVKALMGLNSAVPKKHQWIFLNGRVVSKTILHKKINETLTKKLSIKTTSKLKDKFPDEVDLHCKIPFYFIFISCPNFDFDINYNNKQTFVEFKNCEEINKLIEKLVKFYCGDISLKPITKPNIKEVDNINNDTRKKVKEIMNKILNNNEVENKITHLQNGRKGKIIARNNKKKKNIMNKTPEKTNNNSKDISSIYNMEKINIPVNKKNVRKLVTKGLNNNKKLEIKYKNNKTNYTPNTNKIKNVKKTPSFCDEPLLKKFQQQTDTVKKRCDKLSYQVQGLFNKTFDNHVMAQSDEIQRIILSDNSIDFKMRANFLVQHPEVVDRELVNKQTNSIIKNTNIKQVKTSYDLLKATELEVRPHVIASSEEKNPDSKETGELCIQITPKLTFNSHERTIALNKRKMLEFSPKKSNRNFNNLSKIMHTKFSKNRSQRNKNNNNINLLKAAILQERKNKSMSINIWNESNKSIISKGSFTSNFDKMYNITSSTNYKMSSSINFNFENTYTIDVLKSLHSTNDGINKTYSIQMSTNFSYSNYVINSSPIEDRVSNKNIVSRNNSRSYDNDKQMIISESQSSGRIIEPLGYCEAIINSNELLDVEKEFNISFLDNENRDTIVDIVNDDNPSNEIQEKSQYFSSDVNDNVILKNKTQNKQIILKSVEDNISDIDLLQVLNSDTNNVDEFKIQSRHNFVPKGMSQIFKNTSHKNKGFYNINEEYYEDDIYKQFANDIRDKFEIFEPSVKNVKDIVTRDINKVNDRICKDNSDLIFNSESLKHAKVLGQIDRKFITARIQSECSDGRKSSEFLTLFDQHAVDERMRLERNLSDYFDGNEWKSVSLEAFKLKLSQEDCFYLHNYKEKFSQFGLQWTFSNNEILIHAVPKAILGKNPRKAEAIFTAVKRFISEQIEIIKSIRGNVSLYPKSIMELVFSEACRYAIKFGDPLSINECKVMISALATCKTPFQCAHGRPVMAIIMELSKNNNRSYKIANLNNIKKFKKEYFNNN